MPNPLTHTPTSTNVNVSIDGWPGADELPLPDASLAPMAEQRPATAGLSRRPAVGSRDIAVDSEEDGDLPLLGIVAVDPWSGWPGVQALPMPLQTLPAPAVASASAETAAPDTTPVPPDPGVTPVDFVAAVLSAAFGGLVGLRRGRGMVASVLMTLVQLVGRRPQFNWPWLGRQSARGLALLRLTLGILRVW
jgi:hypothetical protein